ncbi:Protein CMSS1 [Smittium culicis]|nr:Protein CMSS1 [Smittium culicis]
MLKKAFSKLSSLELSSFQAKPEDFMVDLLDSKTGQNPFRDIVRSALKNPEIFPMDTKNKSQPKFGAPKILVICSSAIRSVSVVRDIKTGSNLKVGKLFSKHMKIDEQIDFLQKNEIDVAVGTPNRLLKLLELKKLDTSNLSLLIIDCQRDNKMRTVIDMDDTRKDLSILWKNELYPHSASDSTKIVLI